MAGKKKETASVSSDSTNKLNSAEMQALLKSIQKSHGDSIILKASDTRASSTLRIPTNIFQLDYALGGGFPVGMINTIFGLQSSMKTSLILRCIGNAQKLCADCWQSKSKHDLKPSDKNEINGTYVPACKSFNQVTAAFVDVEGTFDQEWAQILGVDLDNMILSQPSYAEQAIDIADSLLRSGKIDILVLDSLAFLTPTKEIEKSAEGHLMGTQAQLVGKLVRKTISALNDLGNANGKRPTVFWTNQIRETMAMFGSPEVQAAGKAHPYAASVMLKLTAVKAEFENEKEKTESPLYIPIRFKVEKNKKGASKMEGEFKLVVTETEDKKVGDIYDEDRIAEISEKVGLLHKLENATGWYFDNEYLGNSKGLLERKLLTDEAFKERAKKRLIEFLNDKSKKISIADEVPLDIAEQAVTNDGQQ